MKRAIVFIGFILLFTACTKKVQFSDKFSSAIEDNVVKNSTQMETSFDNHIPPLTRNIELTNPRMEGEDILDIQNRLLLLGFTEIGDADGYYGPLTVEVIKKIQKFTGFEQNGIVNAVLWDFIFQTKNSVLLITVAQQKDILDKVTAEYINQIILAYDSMELVETILGDGRVSDTGPFACIYYSPIDRKARKISYSLTPAGGTHQWTCYFINEAFSFIKYEFLQYIGSGYEKTEEEMYFSINNQLFDFNNGIVQYSINENRDGLITDKRYVISLMNEILNGVIDENGAIIPESQAENGFTVTRDGRLVYYQGNDSSITIPAMINGISIIAIFPERIFSGKGITRVTIPDNIKRIVNFAFDGNPLTSITIGSNVNLGVPIGNGIGDPPFYSFDHCFDLLYMTNGYKAGEYNNRNGVWNKNGDTTLLAEKIGHDVFVINELGIINAYGSNDWRYYYDDYKKELREIIIPTKIGGVPVKTIGDKVAKEWVKLDKMTSITIGENVVLNGSFGNSFNQFYDLNEKKAGIYISNNGQWNIK